MKTIHLKLNHIKKRKLSVNIKETTLVHRQTAVTFELPLLLSILYHAQRNTDFKTPLFITKIALNMISNTWYYVNFTNIDVKLFMDDLWLRRLQQSIKPQFDKSPIRLLIHISALKPEN